MKRKLTKVSVLLNFNADYDNITIEAILETGIASEPHIYGDLILTPEQEKVLLNEGPGSEEGRAQAFLIGARFWPNGVVSYELDRRLNE